MKQETGKNKLKTKNDKKIVFVQLIDGTSTQIQQLLNYLNDKKTDDFEFIITNQYIEWNTVDHIIDSLSFARDEYIKKMKNAGLKTKYDKKE